MNQTLFISGGSRGIGLAIARRFYKEGYLVIICGRNEESLAQAKIEMPRLQTFVCDISEKQQVKDLGEKITQQFGALSVLVNNGGTFIQGNLHNEPDEVFEQLMATNINSAYYLTKALLPPMITHKEGTIVNICSVASIRPYPNGGAYCISKYAMLGFGKVLREEMKHFGIRVLNVLPGAVYTDSWIGSGLPEDRFIPVEDIAEIVWQNVHLSKRTVVEDIVIRPFEGDI
jgi:NADP-dependent 3-hydroxy acid dehydrogenase YdfG